MDYKEKYEQALERARQFSEKPYLEDSAGIVEYIFPELKESEDEKIRKALLEMVHDTTGDELWVDYDVHKEEALAWLEKQKERSHLSKDEEQKPWSEEDEMNISIIIEILHYVEKTSSIEPISLYSKKISWLKSLKDRVQSQPKQEWSDVDKDILFRTIDSLKFLKDTISTDPNYAVNIIDIEREITWLKSLRPQNKWKPSDEQMEALNEALCHVDDDTAIHISMLIGKLKKL